jgi:hypothetical protein
MVWSIASGMDGDREFIVRRLRQLPVSGTTVSSMDMFNTPQRGLRFVQGIDVTKQA